MTVKNFFLVSAFLFLPIAGNCADYMLQAGIFSEQKNAISLHVYLLSRNYSAVIECTNSHFKILVGPYKSRKTADLSIARLAAEDNIKAFLIEDFSYESIDPAGYRVNVLEEILEGLISTAFDFLGVDYVYGGMDPRTGIDCSFFVQMLYGSIGIMLPRTSRLQYRVGKKVERGELIPGDLVFFRKHPRVSRIDHVGMYIGDDLFIHATLTAGKVTINSLNEKYFKKRFSGARRQICPQL